MTADLVPIVERLTPAVRVEGTISAAWRPTRWPGEVVWMSWIDEADVPADHRAFCQRWADKAANVLGMGHITLRWFVRTPPGQEPDFYHAPDEVGVVPAGCTRPDEPMTIALNASARGEVVIAVIAHEVRHCQQWDLLKRINTSAKREADADAFAAHFMRHEMDHEIQP